jgi:serine/threonine-protein kinase
MLHIVVRVEDVVTGESAAFVRERSPIIIGRSRDASIVIDRGYLSNLQGTIRFDEREVIYTDLDSLNGATLDGRSLQADEPVVIAPDSALIIGKRLRVMVSTGLAASPPDPSQPSPFAPPAAGGSQEAAAGATQPVSGQDLKAIEKALRDRRSAPVMRPTAVPQVHIPEAAIPEQVLTRPRMATAPESPASFENPSSPAPRLERGPESQPSGALAPKTRLGRYYIVRLIDVGGMGEVYRAEDPDTGHVIAVKTLAPEFVSQPAARARFLQEGKAASLVDHRNVIKIHGYDVHEGIPYLKMEYLRGVGLDKEIERGPLAVERAAEIMGFVCYGMAAVHDHGIIHRDLKPSNIFLAQTDEGEVVKILDFGVSKLRLGSAALTGANAIVGSYLYMSPEQARGGALDPTSDQFAIGVILYELLTGCRAHDGDTPFMICDNIIHGRFRRPRELRPDIPEPLEAVALKAMSLAPDQRFPTVLDLGSAVTEFASPLVRTQLTALISNSRTKRDAVFASQQVPREWFTSASESQQPASESSGWRPPARPSGGTESAGIATGQGLPQIDSELQVVAGGTQMLPDVQDAPVIRPHVPAPRERPRLRDPVSPSRVRDGGVVRETRRRSVSAVARPRGYVVALIVGGAALVAVAVLVVLLIPRSIKVVPAAESPTDEPKESVHTAAPPPPIPPSRASAAREGEVPPSTTAEPPARAPSPAARSLSTGPDRRIRHHVNGTPQPTPAPRPAEEPKPEFHPANKAHILE